MAVKTFASGDILTASDTNTYLNNGGLVYVKSQTVGSGVSSVTVTSAFDATYDHYKVIWSGGTLSALNLITIYMGASTAANGYYGAKSLCNVSGAFVGGGDNNTTQWVNASAGGTGTADIMFDLLNPFAATETLITAPYWELNGASSVFGVYNGVLNNTTSYTSVTIDPFGATTMTGGTITVYGYRKA